MGFFDFLANLEDYAEKGTQRLNARHKMIIEPLASEISGKSVIDLGAHDGRWAYAYAKAGASRVLGLEGRQESIDRFSEFPDEDIKSRVVLKACDFSDGLDEEIAAGNTYDIISILGVYYHTMDHNLILRKVSKLKPEMIVIDSNFVRQKKALIHMVSENTGSNLNAIAPEEGAQVAVVGTPSTGAMDLMANALGYTVDWLDWEDLPKDERKGLGDYFGKKQILKKKYANKNLFRSTCILRRHPDPAELGERLRMENSRFRRRNMRKRRKQAE